ncbi:MAG: phage terminase large subunit family protein [Synergistaceae bacterium]|nr:phage terminase large subunit family protein [Synergistaceae bacterium]
MNFELFRPPPELSISEWADEYRYLSAEGSPEPGKWSTSRAPYQRAMMDAVKSHERVVIMTAAQVGKSEILLNTIGYYIHYEPCPMLMVQPTLEMGKDFSKKKFTPMLRDTPVLSCLIDLKARTKDNNILDKRFGNSAIVCIAGANSPAGLASRSIRILLLDETDRYPPSAGNEGDPISLAMKRTTNFWNRKIIQVSTPTHKNSPISEAFELSSKNEWTVPCPKCGKYQPYIWDNFLYRERTEPVMKCQYCGQESAEREWKRGTGKWEQGCESDIAGFHMNAFASPWVTWPELVANYFEAYSYGEEKLKVWINTVLGEPYENPEGVIEIESIHENCEEYGAQVPDEVLVLTCGVDTQDDRLELEVVGWGMGNQSWGIEYKIFYGDTSQKEVWEQLDSYLCQAFKKATGEALLVSCTCIDSAGHNTDMVYRFCHSRLKRRIFPIIGRGQWGRPSVTKPSRNNRYRVPLFTLGVSTIKGMLHTRLRAQKGQGGYCHFPKDKGTGYDEIYFAGLLSERMVMKRLGGREVVRWEQRDTKTRNEPLDCRVYAIGAYEIFSPDLRKYEAGLNVKRKPVKHEEVPAKKEQIVRAPKRRVIRGIMW